MKERLITVVPPGVLAVLAVGLLAWWLLGEATADLAMRVPGLQGDGLGLGETDSQARTLTRADVGEPIAGSGIPSELAGTWPWFRGPNHDGICDDGVRLSRGWPEAGPAVLWTVELGPGHAGPAVAGGCVYVLDYDVNNEADTMRCLSLDDGREIWRNSYPVVVPENHGMSRTVPAVAGGSVVSLGPKCHVVCWDSGTGQCRWVKDLVHEFGAKVPAWYAGQCPLIDNGRVILAPSGDAFLIAVDCAAGEVKWESPKLRDWEMTHVSIAVMELGGRRTYVYCGSGGAAGIAADDGSLLWETTEWVGRMATCPTPVPVGDDRIFFCSGYKAGSLMVRITEQGNAPAAAPLFRLKPKVFESEQHTPILFQDHLYGVRTKPGGEQLVCLDLEGNEVWNSGGEKFGRGPYLIADGLIYLMDDDGTLTMVEATVEAYRPLGQFQVMENGHDAWGPMAMVEGRLIVRDLTRMVCLDVSDR
jgi:outer membrane protein assembly factor BamB